MVLETALIATILFIGIAPLVSGAFQKRPQRIGQRLARLPVAAPEDAPDGGTEVGLLEAHMLHRGGAVLPAEESGLHL